MARMSGEQAARLAERIVSGWLSDDSRRSGVKDDIRAALLEEPEQDRSATGTGEAGPDIAAAERGREGVATTDRTTGPTALTRALVTWANKNVARWELAAMPEPLRELEGAILALFPDQTRLLADFRWLAGRYDFVAGTPYRGDQFAIHGTDWDEHVAPHLAPPEGDPWRA